MRCAPLVVLLVVACGGGTESAGTGDEADPHVRVNGGPVPSPPTVELSTESGDVVRVHVELARTEAEKNRGLMFRRYLAPDAGMLFLYDQMEHRSFWMESTFIPLDMIFIDRDRVVVGVVEEATPLTRDGREVDGLSQYVLEVGGGFCRRHGIGRGSRARFVGVPGHGETR